MFNSTAKNLLICIACLFYLSGCAESSDGPDNYGSTKPEKNNNIVAGTVIEIGGEWRYRKGTSAPPSDWISVGFDDTSWLVGNSGIGYGDADDATLLSDMQGNYTTLYTRKVVNYDGSFNIDSLGLEIDYDDGFVAYINGQEVARANMPAGQPSFDTLASNGRESGTPVLFNLSGFISLIRNGDNVLAIEVHNASITSSDLSFLPRLMVNMGVSQPPVVTITNGGGTYIQGNTLTLTGTATDAEDGTITGNLAWSSSIDGPIPGSGGSVSTNALSLGTHTITAFVIDSDGNSDSDTISVTVDAPANNPPLVSITSGGGTYIVGNTVTLTGTATDAEDGTITSNLAWSSSIDGSIPGSGGSVSTNTLSLGTHTITASVTDSDGNSDSDTASVTISLTPPPPQPPVITITNGGGTYIQGNTVTLTGTATDAEDGTITGNLAWSSSIDGPIPGSGGTVSTNALSLGTHTITASVTDSDGNSASDTISVTVDAPATNPPLVSITSGGGTYIQGNTVTLTGNATDAEDGTITGNLAWSSSIDGSIPGSGGSVSTNALSLGTHTITASVTDSDGNSASDTISVTVDAPATNPPLVSITSGGGTYIQGNTVTLTGNATDAEDGTITGNLAWSSSIDGPIPGSGGSVNTNALSLGTHTITASVTDSDGNSDSDTASVTISSSGGSTNYPRTLVPGVYDCTELTVHCVDDSATPNQEFSSIQQAVDLAGPGDVVLVHDGIYAGFRIDNSGTPGNEILITGNGNNVIINSEVTAGDGIYISNASYVVVEGFTVDGMSTHGIGAHRASASSPMRGVQVRYNTVSNSGSTNLYMSHSADSLILANTTFDSTSSHGIYLTNAGSDNTGVVGNVTYGNQKNGIHFNGDAGQGGDGLHTGLVVSDNIIYGNVANGIDADGVYDSVFENNLIYENGRYGIRVFRIDSSFGAGNLSFVNNTITANASMAIKLTDDAGGHLFFNNILTDNSGGCISLESSNIISDNNIFTNNCSFTPSNTSLFFGAASFTATPTDLFIDPNNDIYGLEVNSPAIDAGLSGLNGTSAPDADIIGGARDNLIDIGAYEH